MNKLFIAIKKITIITLVVFALGNQTIVEAKNVPPGAADAQGNSANIPANLLFMLDVSGSMNWTYYYNGSRQPPRIVGARNAIQDIVRDSSLTSGVNFGFSRWSSGRAGFWNWSGSITYGRATPCDRYNCLDVRVHKDGAQRISQMIQSVPASGGTDANAFASIAEQYFLHRTFSPRDPNLLCASNYIVVIGDGDWYNHARAKAAIERLYKTYGIKTITVAYGTGISYWGIRYFNEMAIAGGTPGVIIATTPNDLKTQLKSFISSVIANKLTFTAPAIVGTITSGGSLYQAQFEYAYQKEWEGTLLRKKIKPDGTVDSADPGNWDAAKKLPLPDARKIWSVIPNTNYKTNYNNFTASNSANINTLFQLMGNAVPDYHSDTNFPVGTQRCSRAPGVINGNSDDIVGLIEFVRGKDYFDYDGDCNLTEKRTHYFGDIYHSEMVVVGAPNAMTSYANENQESFWRSSKNYENFKAANRNRRETIYVGTNTGILHAIDAKTGIEQWGFVPPFIAASQLPSVANPTLNGVASTKFNGGSNSIYGVDGALTFHDMYYGGKWRTILFVPYGRGGAGFSVLDVTAPNSPLHLFSVFNDITNKTVHHVDHNGTFQQWSYVGTTYGLASFKEAVRATANYQANPAVAATCNNSGTTACFRSTRWTLPVSVTRTDIKVYESGIEITNYSLSRSGSDTILTFASDQTFDASDASPNNTTGVSVEITNNRIATGVTQQPDYDYSTLGETWSAPRIFRMPNQGAGDSNIQDDIYVAVMGGGFNATRPGIGSSLFVINLQDTTKPGKIEKIIKIQDVYTSSNIVNSTPGSPVVITADTAIGANYRGALVYLNDFEGKITKFNLTNMVDDGNGQRIRLYDNTTLFNAQSNTVNARYMFHEMDATIGKSTNTLWLFAGTGDYDRLNETPAGTDNIVMGIRDSNFPYYRSVATPLTANKLAQCKNTTGDLTGINCPTDANAGWYSRLNNYKKVTAGPTVYKGIVYFPIYEPSLSANKCKLGKAYICAYDDECGTDLGSKLSGKPGECKYVGDGILSKIIVHADRLFANITGNTKGGDVNLINVLSASGTVSTYRTSWRENY